MIVPRCWWRHLVGEEPAPDFRLITESDPRSSCGRPSADGTVEFLRRARRPVHRPDGARQRTAGTGWPDSCHRARRRRAVDCVACLARCRATGARPSSSSECRLRRADGEQRWHAVQPAPGPRRHRDAAVVGGHRHRHRRGTGDWPTSSPRGGPRSAAAVETLLSKAPIGFAFIDRDLRVVRVNEKLAAIDGSTASEQSAGRGRRGSRGVPAARAAPPGSWRPGGRSSTPRSNTSAGRRDGPPGPSLVDQLLPGRGGRRDHRDRRHRRRRHRAQAAEAARQQLAAIVDGSGDAIFGVDRDGHRHQLERCRRAAVRLPRRGDHRSVRSR